MSNQGRSYRVNGSSALKHYENTQHEGRLIRFPSDIINAERSYGVERVSHMRNPQAEEPARGSLAGRPLNVFSKAETAAMFVICSVVTFATFFCF